MTNARDHEGAGQGSLASPTWGIRWGVLVMEVLPGQAESASGAVQPRRAVEGEGKGSVPSRHLRCRIALMYPASSRTFRRSHAAVDFQKHIKLGIRHLLSFEIA
jgi:hypothetical protein